MKLRDVLWVLFISILPLIELRGAVPVGAILGIPFYINYICAVVGNLLPVPFILLFIPKILDFMGKFKTFRPVVEWLKRKALKNKDKIAKSESSECDEVPSISDTGSDISTQSDVNCTEGEADSTPQVAKSVTLENTKRHMSFGAFIGLMLFVLLPAPGTGAWTGALVAALFNYPKKKSFLSIALGVLGCGIIMCLASYGVLGFLSFLID